MAEEVLLRFENQGIGQAIAGLNSYNKTLLATQKAQETVATSAKRINTQSIQKSTGQLSGVFEKLKDSMLNTNPAIAKLSTNFSSLAVTGSSVIPVIGGVAIAITAAAAAATAFYALGSRGAALQPTIIAFGNLASQFGDSTTILNKLRAETKSTISDMELMRIATFSLSGASQELGTVLSKDLGNILSNTRKLAVALGRDPAEAQTRFIEAIKKNERELLDELGIIVSAEKAYKDYAKSIGTSATALSDQQKNTAFAIAAIDQLNQRVTQLGDQPDTLENLKVPMVAFQNTIDRLALAIQPAFAPVAKLIADMAIGFENLAIYAMPVIETLATVFGTTFTAGVNLASFALNGLLGDFFRLGQEILPYIVAGITIAGDGFTYFASQVTAATDAIANSTSSSSNSILSFIGINQSVSSVSGIWTALGGDITSIVHNIAYTVAAGGTRIIASFASGILNGGSFVVEAVTAIAKIVADFLVGFSPPKMGPLKNIDKGGENVAKAWAQGFASAMLDPIKKVVGEVDTALGSIGKLTKAQVATRLEALDQALAPFQNRLDIIKGKFEEVAGFADPAIKVLEKNLGKALKSQDIEQVKFLDRQLELLKNLKNAEQEQIDQAELQLALAKSQQAAERALLGIQNERTKAVKETASAGGGGSGAETTPKDATSQAAKKSGGGAGQPASTETQTGGFDGGKAPDILMPESVAQARQSMYGAGLSAIQGFNSGVKDGLENSDLNAATDRFSTSTGGLNEQLGRIREADPAKKISEKFKSLPNELELVFKNAKEKAVAALAGISEDIQGIPESIQANLLTPLAEKFNTAFGEGSPIKLALDGLFGEDNAISAGLLSLQSQLDLFYTTLDLTVTSISSRINDISTPFNSLIPKIESNLALLKGALTNFATGDLGLSSLGNTLVDKMVNVFIGAVNSVIEALNSAISSTVGGFLGLPVVGDAIRELGFPVTIPSIPTRAAGGLNVRGLNLVGERGAELVNFSKPANVFPASLTNSIMDNLSGGGGYSIPDRSAMASNVYNQQRNITSNFNVASPEDAIFIERQRRAYLGY